MTKQVRQSIAPTHILGSTGTVEGSDLGFRSLTTFPFPNMPTVDGNPIVQRGSNSDGEFVRYANGTQHCWTSAPIERANVAFTTAAAGGFRTTGATAGTWTFPVAFSTTSGLQTIPFAGSSEQLVLAAGTTPSTTSVGRILWRAESATIDTAWLAFAVGRWF